MSIQASAEQPQKAMGRRKGGWRLAGRVLLTLVMLLVATEALLRFGLGLGNPVLIAPDAACSYITKPNQNVFRFFVHTYINRYGMRSEDISPERPAGVERVLFVGDSITYGTTHVDQQKLFTQIVQQRLPSIVHSPVQVLNASADAWAIDNEWSWVRSRGIFQSNFVLLVVNDGDLTQPRATITQVGDALPQAKPATAIGELYTRFIAPRVLHITPRSDAGDEVIPDDTAMRENLRDLVQFHELVASQGGRMVLVYLPFRDDLPAVAAPAQTAFRSWSAANNVPMIDLTNTLAAHPLSQICILGSHLSAEGNAFVGQAILKAWSSVIQP